MTSKTSPIGPLGALLSALGVAGCGVDPDTNNPRVEATFTLVDGEEVAVSVESELYTDPVSWVCSGSNDLEAYGLAVSLHFAPWRLPEPGLYDLADLTLDDKLYLMVMWEYEEDNSTWIGFTLADIGTLEIIEMGVEPGDAIVARFVDVDMKPDPDDPNDIVARIDDGLFYCVVP